LGGKVENILVVVDREQRGKENLGRLGYTVYALSKVTELAKNFSKNRRSPRTKPKPSSTRKRNYPSAHGNYH
jgi:orotate phosphoribosyltransferase